jgi:hypothetical protein
MHKQLIKRLKEDTDNPNNISLSLLLVIMSILFGSILIFAPFIYVKNNIYYKSRSINLLYNKYQILLNENRELIIQLEKIKAINKK